ncbi:MAG: hypothetical protein AUJ03_00435 [Deltaproteobacteria bacterium 13_1_40CM_3_71_4]|nr:MAG: hypothetical protein AUJ03_00435 [Deltaproteobacteria bacterium 13_1_40CM_3_71_4]
MHRREHRLSEHDAQGGRRGAPLRLRGQPIPPNVRALFTRARTLAEKTVGADARTRKRALQQAAALLRRADKAVARAAKRKHQAVSADCAAALHGMLGDASARVLAAES